MVNRTVIVIPKWNHALDENRWQKHRAVLSPATNTESGDRKA